MSKICGNLPCFFRVVLTPDSLPLHRRHLPRIEQAAGHERRGEHPLQASPQAGAGARGADVDSDEERISAH